jgi:hypothetical protein
MDNNEEFYIVRHQAETARAYRAKQDYLAMGPGRSLEKLLASYRAQIQNGTGNPPSRHRATICEWSRRWGWVELAGQFDEWNGDRLLEQQIEENKERYRQNLREFSEKHLQVGRAGFKAGTEALKDILEFLDSHPQITSWDEALKAASLVQRLESFTSYWSKALIVDRLLESHDPSDLVG